MRLRNYLKENSQIRENSLTYSIEGLRSELRILLSQKAKDETFKTNLLDKMTYSKTSSSHNEKIKHFITTMEAYYSWYKDGAVGIPIAETHLTFDLDQISIDHIYPQNPRTGERIDELEDLKHNFGNLTILTPDDNSEISNAQFSIKKEECYLISNVRLNRMLAEYAEWNKQIMEQHQTKLMNIALKIFVI